MSSSGASGPGYGAVVAISAITSALVAAGVVLAMVEGFRLVPDEEVPELAGLTIDGARGVLDARGLRLVQRGERHHEEIAEGLVAAQEPGARSVVRGGAEVTVFVSLGPDRVELPDLAGLHAPAATARLANLGLRATTRDGGEGEAGTVASMRPAAGTRVERDTVVELTIVPADHSDTENAPNYRIHLGDEDGPEVGAGWTRTGEKAGEYVALQLEDPFFPQPLRANLFQSGSDRSTFHLQWTRPAKRESRT